MVRQYIPDPVIDPSSLSDTQNEVSPPPPTNWQKFSTKFKEEPLVPIGCVATVAALLGASSALQKGNRTQFNKFLRYRVAAQGFTVVAALGGSLYYQQQRRAAKDAEARAKLEAAGVYIF
ncbi:Respiratory supercomplex factor 1, mitochondrial [Rhodosporidiobolus nylandii]